MSEIPNRESESEDNFYLRLVAEQVFSRTARAPLEKGNSIRILRDAEENYPAWIEAIKGAGKYVYLEDLKEATEIVLSERKVRPMQKRPRWSREQKKMGAGSVGRAGVVAIRLGSAVSAAIANRRILGPAEAQIMFFLCLILLVLSAIAVFWPRLISLPAAFLGTWMAVSLGIRAYKLYMKYRRNRAGLSNQE